jgi:glycosyltransferase involved in cell wall biosynthesis
MISVLTITYQRHNLLEEAIESFLQQEGDFEMVVVNDSPSVEYTYDHPRVKILNCKERFPSIAAKLEWGYRQCKYDFIYRLDDDDLIAPKGLKITADAITAHPGYEIYRGPSHYFYVDNKYVQKSDNINNGNCYTKDYLGRIKWPDKSGDEDADITFGHHANIFKLSDITMIYRWGMGTLHISGMGILPSKEVLERTDKVLNGESGTIALNPHFKEDYYGQLPKPYAWHR